jgi:hypothetical protein
MTFWKDTDPKQLRALLALHASAAPPDRPGHLRDRYSNGPFSMEREPGDLFTVIRGPGLNGGMFWADHADALQILGVLAAAFLAGQRQAEPEHIHR